MNIDLELYRVFYTVAKHKHMTKASEELHISQPAISQSIKKLEEQLGGTLFLRSNKGMELTEEGKMLYEYIKGALELINNAENDFTSFKDLSKGEIKIGCSTTLTKLILMDALKDFHKDYPNISIIIYLCQDVFYFFLNFYAPVMFIFYFTPLNSCKFII